MTFRKLRLQFPAGLYRLISSLLTYQTLLQMYNTMLIKVSLHQIYGTKNTIFHTSAQYRGIANPIDFSLFSND